MRKSIKIMVSAVALTALAGLTGNAYGAPAFARQTGLDCSSCHASPGYPTLNTFGAAFKAAGYTQGNEDQMMGDGEALSIPKALPISFVFKVRNPVDMSGGHTSTKLELPDEAALLIGGRIAKNIGWLLEAAADDFASGKVVFAPELGPIRLGIVPWFSDLTPAYMFETSSTGAVRNIRIAELRKLVSAQNAISYGGLDGKKMGLGLYVWHPMGYVAFTEFFSDGAGTWGTDAMGLYARAAVTPSFGPVDASVGVQYYGGSIDNDGTGATSLGWLGVDAQALMDVGIPLGVFVTFATDSVNNKSSLNIAVDANVIEPLSVFLAFRAGLTNVDSQVGGGLKYQIVRNVKLEVDVAYDLANGGVEIMPQVFGSW